MLLDGGGGRGEAGRREEGGGGGSGWHPLTSPGFTRDRQDIQEGPG